MSDFFPNHNKPAREYAAAIAKLATLEERRAALEAVPPEVREIVKTHVKNTLSLVWHWRKRIKEKPTTYVPQCVRVLLDEYS